MNGSVNVVSPSPAIMAVWRPSCPPLTLIDGLHWALETSAPFIFGSNWSSSAVVLSVWFRLVCLFAHDWWTTGYRPQLIRITHTHTHTHMYCYTVEHWVAHAWSWQEQQQSSRQTRRTPRQTACTQHTLHHGKLLNFSSKQFFRHAIVATGAMHDPRDPAWLQDERWEGKHKWIIKPTKLD